MKRRQHTAARARSTTPTLQQLAEHILDTACRTRVKLDVLPDGEFIRIVEPAGCVPSQKYVEAWKWHLCKEGMYNQPALYAAVRALLKKRARAAARKQRSS